MTVFEAITERYSYRAVFQAAAVPRSDLQKILEAGLAAPSGCNAQTAYLIGIDDPGYLTKAASILGSGQSVSSAPAAICVVTHEIPSYKDSYFNIQDYSAAIENMLLTITGLGYASCWIEGEITTDMGCQKAFADLFAIPDGYAVVAYLPLGIPVSPGKRAIHKPFEERAFFNSFGSK
jgi:nitroreductase